MSVTSDVNFLKSKIAMWTKIAFGRYIPGKSLEESLDEKIAT